MRRLPICLILTCILIAACGRRTTAGGDGAPEADTARAHPSEEVVEADPTDDARRWADSIMTGMTLEEMAGQLIMPAVYSDSSEPQLRMIASYAADCHVGGVVLLKGSVEGARQIADTLRRVLPAPPLVAIDAEWGLAMRLADTERYPRNGRIASDAEAALMREYGREVAEECREAGVNMVLGPVLDVLPADRRTAAGVIGTRSFGSDPARVARLGVAYAEGLEEGGVISVAKHFPGHGSADADSHKTLPRVSKTRSRLEEEDLMPFSRYADSGLSGIMTGHLYVPALDSVERPVTVSEPVLRGLLRGEMGFDGLIVTDAMNMGGADGNSAADAIMAGADIVLAPAFTRDEADAIAEAVREGRLPLAELRDRVRRVLLFKYRFIADTTAHAGADRRNAERIRTALAGGG